MKIKDALAVVMGLAALVFGIYKFYLFVRGEDTGSHNYWWAIGAALVAFICGLVYFLGHVRPANEVVDTHEPPPPPPPR